MISIVFSAFALALSIATIYLQFREVHDFTASVAHASTPDKDTFVVNVAVANRGNVTEVLLSAKVVLLEGDGTIASKIDLFSGHLLEPIAFQAGEVRVLRLQTPINREIAKQTKDPFGQPVAIEFETLARDGERILTISRFGRLRVVADYVPPLEFEASTVDLLKEPRRGNGL